VLGLFLANDLSLMKLTEDLSDPLDPGFTDFREALESGLGSVSSMGRNSDFLRGC